MKTKCELRDILYLPKAGNIGQVDHQACDYAYTIQGWIKAVNGEEVDQETMMGWDGVQTTSAQVTDNINKHASKDAYGYSLSYYDDDYKATNTGFLNHSQSANPNLTADIYNGNIRGMFTTLSDQNEAPIGTHQTNYTYDQLNRIKSMTGHNRAIGQTATASGYSSNYSFDANGNLLTLQRETPNGQMDDFGYDYIDQTNKLTLVHDDPALSGTSTEDIDDQVTALTNLGFTAYDLQDETTHNYQYDEIGQLRVDKTEEIEEIEWKVTNKVRAIRRYSWSEKPDLEFEYDAMGNRISKRVIPKNPDGTINTGDIVTTYYYLDAQGNQMAFYKLKTEDYLGNNEKIVELSERNLYGSSRLGQEQVGEVIASTNVNLININTQTQNIVGDKQFYGENHLGNNSLVFTDRKLPEPDGQGGIEYFLADNNYYAEYFPYGMILRDGGDGPRYGFNGKERDDEVSGNGNVYDYGFRIYNPRIGRFLSMDPLRDNYPWFTPYQFAGNSPIRNVDVDGLEQLDYSKFQKGMISGEQKIKNVPFPSSEDGEWHPVRKYTNNPYWYTKGDRELYLRDNVSPTDAILHMADNPKMYEIECGQFVQGIIYLGMIESMGKEEFDKYMRENAREGKIVFSNQQSTGINSKQIYDKVGENWYALKGSDMGLVKLKPNKVVEKSQIGTRIAIETTGLENTVFANENIVKVGNDQYLAQGLAEGPISLEEVKSSLAQKAVEVGAVKQEDVTDRWIRENVKIVQIEISSANIEE